LENSHGNSLRKSYMDLSINRIRSIKLKSLILAQIERWRYA
jgi:hypothetical protein